MRGAAAKQTGLAPLLSTRGYRVDLAATGQAALDALEGHHVHMNAEEFELLAYLVLHANRVLTYRTILLANPAVHTTSGPEADICVHNA